MTNAIMWGAFRAGLMAVCLGLAACGGGDGGGDVPVPVPVPAPAAMLFAGSLPVAQFIQPRDVAQDAAGNVYVADSGYHTISKVSRDGIVTTLAGAAGQPGFADGTGANARFNRPFGVAVDAAGNVYVADSGNSTLRKITAGGVVTTIAGGVGQPGNADGPAASARFRSPRSIAVDGAGNIYVTDDYAVRKLAPNGTVSTFAGKAGEFGNATGNGAVARFSSLLSSVAVDGAGNVYVAENPDIGQRGLRKFDVNANVLPFGRNPNGILSLTYPVDISVDAAGNVYALLNGIDIFVPGPKPIYRSIVRITPDGLDKTTVWGDSGGAIAVGPDGRLVVVSEVVGDASAGTIRLIDTQQGKVTTLAGANGAGAGDGPVAQARFNGPRGLAAAPDGTLYVADTGNSSIRKITPAGVVSTVTTYPALRNVAVGPNGAVYAVGEDPAVGRRFDAIAPDGKITRVGSSLLSSGVLAVDAAGNLYTNEGRDIVVIAPSGAKRVLAADVNPQALAVDAAGNVYFIGFATVGVVDPSGKVVILAGRTGDLGWVDGTGQDARFFVPRFLTLDPSGNMYVTDGTQIRRITPGGTVKTIADLSSIEAIQQAFNRDANVTGLAWAGGALYATVFNSIIRVAPLN